MDADGGTGVFTGRQRQAEKVMARLRELTLRISNLRDVVPLCRAEDFTRLADGLRKAKADFDPRRVVVLSLTHPQQARQLWISASRSSAERSELLDDLVRFMHLLIIGNSPDHRELHLRVDRERARDSRKNCESLHSKIHRDHAVLPRYAHREGRHEGHPDSTIEKT
jgi:hypothetical protein